MSAWTVRRGVQVDVLVRAIEAGAFDLPPDQVVTADGALRTVEAFLGETLLPTVVARVGSRLDVRFKDVPHCRSWRILRAADAFRLARSRDRGRRSKR